MIRRVLVTGGAGFIGSHLCDALQQRDIRVRVLDDLSTGSRRNLLPDTELIVGDVADPMTVQAALNGVDGCFHLAAIASVERSTTEWLACHRTNLTATITLFDAIRQMPFKIPVVYASSAAVYGDCPTSPITEAAEKQPLSAYGADKYGCELHARVAAHVHAIPSVGLRFFNVYGPRQDPRSPYSGVISIFCQRIMNGQDIDIHGDGLQTRDFIYVTDVVYALVTAMESAIGAPNALDPGAVFNVCTGQPTSVIELAKTIMQLKDYAVTMRSQWARVGDVRTSVGCPEYAKKMLGLSATVPLHQGLAEVLRWMQP